MHLPNCRTHTASGLHAFKEAKVEMIFEPSLKLDAVRTPPNLGLTVADKRP